MRPVNVLALSTFFSMIQFHPRNFSWESLSCKLSRQQLQRFLLSWGHMPIWHFTSDLDEVGMGKNSRKWRKLESGNSEDSENSHIFFRKSILYVL